MVSPKRSLCCLEMFLSWPEKSLFRATILSQDPFWPTKGPFRPNKGPLFAGVCLIGRYVGLEGPLSSAKNPFFSM